jgi:tRNA(Ile)-lysidine synthase
MMNATNHPRSLMPGLPPMTLSAEFEQRFATAWPVAAWQDVTVLLAVSGGADSVALLRVMAALKRRGDGRLAVAHFNHQLRGAESAADESLVVEAAARLGLQAYVGHAISSQASSSEESTRTARYEFLERLAGDVGARYVVTAHTADDQAETVLHRILRGTGIGGLSGIPRTRQLGAATLIRPLLGFSRCDLAAYLADLGQAFRQDASNADLRYTRNRIRHELLPQLAEQYNPRVVEALLRLANVAGEVQSVIESLARLLLERSVSFRADRVEVDVRRIQGEPRAVVREMLMLIWQQQQWRLQAMGYAEFDQLAEMLLSADSPAKRVFPDSVLAERSGESLLLSRSR